MADNERPSELADSSTAPPLTWEDLGLGEPTARLTIAPGAPTTPEGDLYSPDPFESAAARQRSRYGRLPIGDVPAEPSDVLETAADIGRGLPHATATGLNNALWMSSLFAPQPEQAQGTQQASNQIQEDINANLPQSQTRLGKLVNAPIEVAANPFNWVGSGTIPFKAGWNAASGVMGELARQRFEGTPYERLAHLAGSWSPVAAEQVSRLYRYLPSNAAGVIGGRLRQPQPAQLQPDVANAPGALFAPRLASPEEIAAVARRTQAEGITQPALRQVYQELGLTGQPPSALAATSLAQNQPAAAVAAARDLKLADRAALDTLTPAQRKQFQLGNNVPGFMLPSTEAAQPALYAFEPLRKEAMTAQKLFDQRPGPPIFDLSPATLNRVPDVPQFPLPRVAPALTERLASVPRGGLQRVERAAKAAPLENWGWYNLMQARDLMHALHGPERGEQAFQAWLDGVAGTSMVNPIDSNLRSSTWYLQQVLAGRPLPEIHSVADPVSGKSVRYMVGTPPPGYGAKSQQQHAERVREYLSNSYDPVANPKPISYRTGLGGNWMPRTVDTHDIRNFVGMPAALELFGENAGLLPKEYAYLEQLGQRAADRAGATQAAQQAATWVGGGSYTKLKSYPAPLLTALNRRAHVTAAVRGISPQQALEEAFTGKRALLGLGGAAIMGGLANQVRDNSDQYQ